MTESGGRGEVVRLLMEHRSSLFAFILAIVHDYDAAEVIFAHAEETRTTEMLYAGNDIWKFCSSHRTLPYAESRETRDL